MFCDYYSRDDDDDDDNRTQNNDDYSTRINNIKLLLIIIITMFVLIYIYTSYEHLLVYSGNTHTIYRFRTRVFVILQKINLENVHKHLSYVLKQTQCAQCI